MAPSAGLPSLGDQLLKLETLMERGGEAGGQQSYLLWLQSATNKQQATSNVQPSK